MNVTYLKRSRVSINVFDFYRAMLRRAVIAMASCLFVCLSVTLRYHGHIGWKSWKIMSRLTGLTFLLSADSNITDLLQMEHPEILAESRNKSGI